MRQATIQVGMLVLQFWETNLRHTLDSDCIHNSVIHNLYDKHRVPFAQAFLDLLTHIYIALGTPLPCGVDRQGALRGGSCQFHRKR